MKNTPAFSTKKDEKNCEKVLDSLELLWYIKQAVTRNCFCKTENSITFQNKEINC